MRYTLLMHYAEQTGATLSDEDMAEAQRAFSAYAAALHGAGVLIAAEVLRSSESTTTVSRVDGELRVQDGPFADTKEQLAGTFVIDVDDLDAAIGWAAQSPSVGWGAVEIRPGATFTRDGVWVMNG
jgi:hypothetical protein